MSESLLSQVNKYQSSDDAEMQNVHRLQRFLTTNENPFARQLVGESPECGHVTGSAWIISPDRQQCIMLYHAKLGKWVQPGGHCDGQADVRAVAQREAVEETGLQVLALQPTVFDVDIHSIPEYWNTPEHLHFDVRYLFSADPRQTPISNHESHAVRWVSLQEAIQLSEEETIARMVRKTMALRD